MQKDTHEDKTFHFRCSNGNLFEDINLHLGVELNDIKIWICYLHCFAGQSDLFMRIELFVDNFSKKIKIGLFVISDRKKFFICVKLHSETYLKISNFFCKTTPYFSRYYDKHRNPKFPNVFQHKQVPRCALYDNLLHISTPEIFCL